MVNPWVQHIRKYASKNGQTYGCALSDPKCRDAYKKKGTEKQATKTELSQIQNSNEKFQKMTKAEKWKVNNAGENAFSSRAEVKRFLNGTMNKKERAWEALNDKKIQEFNKKLVINNEPLPQLKKKKTSLIAF